MSLRVIFCFLVGVICAAAQNPQKCPKGYQPYGERCVSQRMADYISCVEASGANHQEITEEVNQLANKQLSGEAKGAGSGVVAKGSGSLALNASSEKELVKKIQQKWYSDAMKQCAKVLDAPRKNSSNASQPLQDNSVHVDKESKIEQHSSGDCSPNIVGGANTVNCGPPPPPPLSLAWQTSTNQSREEGLYTYTVTITVNTSMSPVSVGVLCSSPPDRVQVGTHKGRMAVGERAGVQGNVAFVYYEGTPMTPGDELYLTLDSKIPLVVLDVKPATFKD